MVTRGMCVLLLGPDGAGKTTLGQSLDGALHVRVRYLYSGLWQQAPRRRRLDDLPGGPTVRRLLLVARVGTLARWYRARGELVVLDRSAHEVRLRSGAGLKSRLTALVVRLLTPTPDLVILLDAPAELLFARKGEHTIEILDRLRGSYRAMLEHFPAHAIVDAQADADTVRFQVAETITQRWPAGLVRTDMSRAGSDGDPRSPEG